MANVLSTDINYTYTGIQSSELFYAPSVQVPSITSLFKVMTGVRSKMQLTVPNSLSKIVKSLTNCTLTASGTTTISNRTLTTCDMYFHVPQCWDAFRDTYLEEQMPTGLDEMELGAYILGIIQTLLADAISRDVFRIASFGDTGDADANWNQCDGLWTKLIDGVAAYEITKVNSITTLNQTSATRALDYLQNLFVGAEIVLKQMPKNMKAFYVTGNVYENLVLTYANFATNGGFTNLFRDGEGKLYYAGIEIIELYGWDSALEDATCPLYGVVNTLIMYSAKDNNVIGVGSVADMDAVRQYYSNEDDNVHFKGKFNFGYQYVHGSLTAVSYGLVS